MADRRSRGRWNVALGTRNFPTASQRTTLHPGRLRVRRLFITHSATVSAVKKRIIRMLHPAECSTVSPRVQEPFRWRWPATFRGKTLCFCLCLRLCLSLLSCNTDMPSCARADRLWTTPVQRKTHHCKLCGVSPQCPRMVTISNVSVFQTDPRHY